MYCENCKREVTIIISEDVENSTINYRCCECFKLLNSRNE